MKKLLAPISMIILTTLTISSCSKTDLKSPVTTSSQTQTNGSGGGGGGTAGGGGGTPVTPTAVDTTPSPLPIEDIITVGTWKVTNYVEGVENSTSKFSKFVFTFQPDGTMIANESGNITTGSWYYHPAIFYYGIPIYGSSPDGFNISIGTTRPLILLSKNLFISKKTSTTFYLDSINPAEDAHATFQKI
jgi:hypothetical protein